MDEPATIRLLDHLIERLSAVEYRLARMEEQYAREAMLKPLEGLRGGELFAGAYDGLPNFVVEVLPRRGSQDTRIGLFPARGKLKVSRVYRDDDGDEEDIRFSTPGARGASRRLARLAPKAMLVVQAGIVFEGGTSPEEALRAYVAICKELGQSPEDARMVRVSDVAMRCLELFPEGWGSWSAGSTPWKCEALHNSLPNPATTLRLGWEELGPVFDRLGWQNWSLVKFSAWMCYDSGDE